MSVTVNIRNNPTRDTVGQMESDAVTCTSGFTSGEVTYQLRRRDQVGDTISHTRSTVADAATLARYGDALIYASNVYITYQLPMRTHYQVRCRQNSGEWTAWTSFKTRDKKYQSPGAITQLSDDSWQNPTLKTSKTITVTNSAKSTEVQTSRGSTVTNTDTGYNSTSSVTYTTRGATIVNSD